MFSTVIDIPLIKSVISLMCEWAGGLLRTMISKTLPNYHECFKSPMVCYRKLLANSNVLK